MFIELAQMSEMQSLTVEGHSGRGKANASMLTL